MYIEFKPGQKHASKGACISETPDAFADCGYLLGEDEVVIDIDSIGKDQIRKMIDLLGIATQVVWTERGAHLYFTKPAGFVRAKNGPCALGFEIETKHLKNAPRGVTIKRNGLLRDIENEGKRQELPWYFYMQKQFSVMTGVSDGRNNALFSHRMKLDNHDETDIILRFINEVLFDSPLPEDEIEHISRSYEVSGGDKLEEYIIADMLMEELKCVVYQGQIWWWEGGRYVNDKTGTDFKKIIYTKCVGKNTRFVEEVEKQVFYRGKHEYSLAFPIRFRNGIVSEGDFIPIEKFTEFTPYYIDIDYLPNAEIVPEIDEYIDNITDHDGDYRKLLLEAMAYAMITDPEKIRTIGQFFMFRGDGANGKGTLLAIMRKIYGDDNCTALSIHDLADPRYQVTMIGKLANLGDDVQPEAINNNQMKILKNISTADMVATRQLFKQSISATFIAKLYFTTNSDIRTFEKGYAYQRRVKWLPMFNKVEKPDPKFITRMTSREALQYWIRLIVEAYMRLYENGHMTVSEVVEEYNRQYHIENNYMAVFLQTLDIDTDVLGKTGPEVKQIYLEYNDDDSKPYRPKLLAEALKELGIGKGIANVNGKTRRIFMKQEDTTQKIL